MEVLPYAFSLLYACKYDPIWQQRVEQVKKWILSKKISYKPRDKSLPFEAVLEIFQYVDAKTLCRSAATCRAWYLLASDEVLWSRLLMSKFSVSLESFRASPSTREAGERSAKSLYVLSARRFHDLVYHDVSFNLPRTIPRMSAVAPLFA